MIQYALARRKHVTPKRGAAFDIEEVQQISGVWLPVESRNMRKAKKHSEEAMLRGIESIRAGHCDWWNPNYKPFSIMMRSGRDVIIND